MLKLPSWDQAVSFSKFKKHWERGFTKGLKTSKRVRLATDGASVMTGCEAGDVAVE